MQRCRLNYSFVGSMDTDSEALSVDDVYILAEEIGKEFECLIDGHGVDMVKKLMTKVICVLEYLEAYAIRNDSARDEIMQLKAQVYQLEQDKHEKAESRSKFEKEIEQYEDVWRQEISDLGNVVSKLQEQNSKLCSSLKEKENYIADQGDQESRKDDDAAETEDIVVLKRLRDALCKQSEQMRQYEREVAQKTTELENLRQQLEHAKQSSQEQSRRRRRLQAQVKQFSEERADLCAQLQGQQQQLETLRQNLGIAVRDRDDLLNSSVQGADLKENVIINPDDPCRPRFTLDELKQILFERNELKAKVSDLEDELALYRPRPVVHAHTPADYDLPVHGPINREPAEKVFSLGRASGIRKFFPSALWPGRRPT
ncbi:RILP-like protein homolog isoform X2 [Ornithodoros turicata]|uniref:RILP-like protein homolog isoform X2 n=1 Tax=Ornithodoros turicata TaxID=34597 RepID=UPI0031388AEB